MRLCVSVGLLYGSFVLINFLLLNNISCFFFTTIMAHKIVRIIAEKELLIIKIYMNFLPVIYMFVPTCIHNHIVLFVYVRTNRDLKSLMKETCNKEDERQ